MTLAYGVEAKKHLCQQTDYRGTWMHWRSGAENEPNPEENKFIMFSRTLKETANKPVLISYGIQLSYFPHAKFLGITFDHNFTFKKHFEDILECCQQKYHHTRMLVDQMWDQAHKQFCKSINNARLIIWGNFHNNRFGHYYQQTAEIAELFHQASISFI